MNIYTARGSLPYKVDFNFFLNYGIEVYRNKSVLHSTIEITNTCLLKVISLCHFPGYMSHMKQSISKQPFIINFIHSNLLMVNTSPQDIQAFF